MSDPFDAAPPIPDAELLIAQMRAGDGDRAFEARRLLYRRTFSTESGRAVLADFLMSMGVGAIRGPDLSRDERTFADGQAAAALTLMNAAGFDQPTAVMLLLTEKLEGQNHDGHDGQYTGEGRDAVDGQHLDDLDDVPS